MGLDTVELLWEVESVFDVKISDPEAAQMHTVGDLNLCIARQIAARASTPDRPVAPEPSITWALLVSVVVANLGVPPEKVTPEARWVRDLGAS